MYIKNVEPLNNIWPFPEAGVYGVKISPDGQYMVAGHSSGKFIKVYKKINEAFTLLSSSFQLPSTGEGVAWSPDSQYFAVAHMGSPYISIFKKDGATFTKLPNPAIRPASTGYDCAWSNDGTYLAVAHTASPYITIYKKNGDTFDKLSNPDILPTGDGQGCSFSPNANYLAVSHKTSPYITVYKRSGDAFTKIDNPVDLPAYNATKCAFSPDGTHLAVINASTAPLLKIYELAADVLTKLADPDIMPTTISYMGAIAYSPSGEYLVVGQTVSPNILVYKRNLNTYTKLADLPDINAGECLGATFSPDNNSLVCGHVSANFLTMYDRDGDTFTKKTTPYNPATVPTSTVFCCALSYDGTYMALGMNGATHLRIYKRDVNGKYQQIDTPVEVTSTPYTVKFSDDATYLFVGTVSSPYFMIFKNNADVYTKLPNPTSLPTGSVKQLDISSDATYIILAVNDANYGCKIYKRTGDTFAALTSIPSITYGANTCAITPDASYACIQANTQSLNVLKKTSDTSYTLDFGPSLPMTLAKVSFSADSTKLAAIGAASEIVSIYDMATYSKIAKLTRKTYSPVTGVFAPKENTLFLGFDGSPYAKVYRDLTVDGSLNLINKQDMDWLAYNTPKEFAFSRDGNWLAVAMTSNPFIQVFKVYWGGDILVLVDTNTGDILTYSSGWQVTGLNAADIAPTNASRKTNFLTHGFDASILDSLTTSDIKTALEGTYTTIKMKALNIV